MLRLIVEAEQRKRDAGKHWAEGGRDRKKTPSQKIDEGFDPNAGRADQQLAELFDTSSTYVADARKLKAKAPDPHQQDAKSEKRLLQLVGSRHQLVT